MSKTHNAHLATSEHAARGNTRRRLRTHEERAGKTAKAARKGQRSALRETRKEYVR